MLEGSGGKPELVVFQDGVERARLPANGMLPGRSEDIFALVDLMGNVKGVSLVAGARPPEPPPPEAEAAASEGAG